VSAFLFGLWAISSPLAFGLDSEIEPNNAFRSAQGLNQGQVIRAVMASPTDRDVFAVNVPRESLVTLSFQALPRPSQSIPTPLQEPSDDLSQEENAEEIQQAQEPSELEAPPLPVTEPSLPSTIGMEQAVEGLVGAFFGNTSGFPWRWRVGLSSAPNPEGSLDKVDFFFGARIDVPSPQVRTLGLKPGLYFIEIGPIMDLPLVRNRLWSDQPYEIGVSIQPASPDRNEIEPNNTLISAQRILIGHEISGGLSGSSDKDLYRFTVAQPGYVELHFSHEPLSTQNCTWQIDLSSLHGDELEPVESLCSSGSAESLDRVLLLEPGGYALEIRSPDASSYSSKGYVFSLKPWQP
jgi:hypothetical protein